MGNIQSQNIQMLKNHYLIHFHKLVDISDHSPIRLAILNKIMKQLIIMRIKILSIIIFYRKISMLVNQDSFKLRENC